MQQQFKIIKELGQGTFGKVNLAQRQQQFYAIKSFKQKQNYAKQQYDVMCGFDHPNILKTYHHPQLLSRNCILMEYCHHGNLADFMKKKGVFQLNVDIVIQILRELAHAVLTIHKKGVVHRDLKLSNILINQQAQIKIADFGLAKCIQQSMPKTQCGTLSYMAPQVECQTYYNQKCDMWSLGVIVFKLLYNKPPFTSIFKDSRLQFPQSPRIPTWLKEILNKLLKYNPEQRLDSTSLLQKLLKQTEENHQLIEQFILKQQKKQYFFGSQIIKKDIIGLTASKWSEEFSVALINFVFLDVFQQFKRKVNNIGAVIDRLCLVNAKDKNKMVQIYLNMMRDSLITINFQEKSLSFRACNNNQMEQLLDKLIIERYQQQQIIQFDINQSADSHIKKFYLKMFKQLHQLIWLNLQDHQVNIIQLAQLLDYKAHLCDFQVFATHRFFNQLQFMKQVSIEMIGKPYKPQLKKVMQLFAVKIQMKQRVINDWQQQNQLRQQMINNLS